MLAVWVGEDPVATEAFDGAAIPHYATESDAVAASCISCAIARRSTR